LFLRRRVELDLDEELQYHLDEQIAQNPERGIDPDEARFAALRSLDGLTQRKRSASIR